MVIGDPYFKPRKRHRLGLLSFVTYKEGWQIDIARDREDTFHLSLQKYPNGLVLGVTRAGRDYYGPSLRLEWF